MVPSHSATQAPKVLFLSALQVFPTRSGGHTRSFGLATSIARQGFDVFVYSLVGRKDDYLARRPSAIQTWPDGVKEYVDRGPMGFLLQYGSYALGWPPLWIPAYLRAAVASPRETLLPRLLREKLTWCDVVIADFPYVYPAFTAQAAEGRLRVLSTHNVEHHLRHGRGCFRGPLTAAVRRTEIAAAEACDILVACCESDKQFFDSHARVHRSILVPNGVDVRRFHGIDAHRTETRRALGIADDVTVFLFMASKWGPNSDAFERLRAFARADGDLLARTGVHVLVVGGVAAEPVRMPGLTATGPVDRVEPYVAAADAALNPVRGGAGTNLKTCEYIAARLPIVTTAFGARGFRIEDGRTGFVIEDDGLAGALSAVRRLFETEPTRLRQMAEQAYAENEGDIDMDAAARPLAQAMRDGFLLANAGQGV